ncbi:arsenic resistance N-acetyltransferase ArsN2 [Brevundimonas sp.]|uniref:arsenic resistance N-acetyltransferase ArsN2 n=1 Tax=Brevundimonas sp. TaxID=1871086 RepID=UPI001D57D646|nr:arsenic resistance N-acetyltransferase ArsN2 [Brevundimonas sp.]MBA4001534.1 tyrosine protein phosphatase [Brevundimonas sp.]
MLTAEPVAGEDAGLIAALTAEHLPTEDLNQPGRRFHRFIDEQGLVGFGGLEGHGPDRLIRSIVTAPGRRGQGLGRVLLAALEAAARQDGVERLHLLTTTAAPFFIRNGYQAADRDTAPNAIAASREFASLCPASAAYLIKAVAP